MVQARAPSPGFGFADLKPKPKLSQAKSQVSGFRALTQAKHIARRVSVQIKMSAQTPHLHSSRNDSTSHSAQPSSLFLPPLMPPLTRTDTRTSVFSWWSDSNLLLRYGPTINIHAVAKPLMKLMYHRQAKEFIKKNQGSRLSREMLEIYWSYLP
jgi:hypothetical protein